MMNNLIVPIFKEGKMVGTAFILEKENKHYLVSAAHTFCISKKVGEPSILVQDESFSLLFKDVSYKIDLTKSIVEFDYKHALPSGKFWDIIIIPITEISIDANEELILAEEIDFTAPLELMGYDIDAEQQQTKQLTNVEFGNVRVGINVSETQSANNFVDNCFTAQSDLKEGFSGSPVLIENSNKVVGLLIRDNSYKNSYDTSNKSFTFINSNSIQQVFNNF
ncbi:MAG: hypothetical protein ACI9DK_002065 [Vicingaceae bacterium]|jgi:hypothetical protein